MTCPVAVSDRRGAGALTVLLLVLTGCASLNDAAPESTMPLDVRWQAHRAAVAEIGDFTASARVAFQAKDRGASAKLRWRERGGRYSLVVEPPLGGGTFMIRERGQGVELVTADGAVDASASPEALVEKHLEMTLPVSGVRYWMKGVPDPGVEVAYLSLDDEGRARDLEQSRWRVSVLEYTLVNGTPLPRRLFLARDDVKVRIVVDRWSIAS